MFCTSCGRENADDAKFCQGCGKELASSNNTQTTKSEVRTKVEATYEKIEGINVFEKVDFLKKYLTDKKIVVILGLIGAAILFVSSILYMLINYSRFNFGMIFISLFRSIISSPMLIGNLVLFIVLLATSKSRTGTAEKVARIIFTVFAAITILIEFISMCRYFTFWNFLATGIDITIFIYYIFTFFTKKRGINNNIYLGLAAVRYIILVGISMIITIAAPKYLGGGFNIGRIFVTMISIIGNVLMVPYFYNSYYERRNPLDISKITKGDSPKVTTGIKCACFFVPLIGIILYATNAKDDPTYAKTCGKFAIFGAVTWVALSIVLAIIPFAIMFMAF